MARGSYRQPKRPKPEKHEPPVGELLPANVGRPIDLEQVEARAAIGLSMRHIAWMFGIEVKHLPHRPDYPQIAEAWRRGVAKGAAVVASRLMRSIDEGNVIAQIFYLKTHAGWNENPNFLRPSDMDETGHAIINVDDARDGPRPVVVLPPDATSFEEWEQRARSAANVGKPAAQPATVAADESATS